MYDEESYKNQHYHDKLLEEKSNQERNLSDHSHNTSRIVPDLVTELYNYLQDTIQEKLGSFLIDNESFINLNNSHSNLKSNKKKKKRKSNSTRTDYDDEIMACKRSRNDSTSDNGQSKNHANDKKSDSNHTTSNSSINQSHFTNTLPSPEQLQNKILLASILPEDLKFLNCNFSKNFLDKNDIFNNSWPDNIDLNLFYKYLMKQQKEKRKIEKSQLDVNVNGVLRSSNPIITSKEKFYRLVLKLSVK